VYPRYFALPNVFMLPHIGSSTLETRIAMAQVLVAGLAQFGRSEPAGNRLA
jgi:glyoxylate reductase